MHTFISVPLQSVQRNLGESARGSMGNGNAHVRTITSLRVCMKKLTQGALILIVLSAVTVQFLHLPHSPKNPFCPDCSGLKSTADSFNAFECTRHLLMGSERCVDGNRGGVKGAGIEPR